MAEHVELHIGRVVRKETAKQYIEGDPLERIKMHCVHGFNLFNPCILCDQHFTNRAIGFFKNKER